MNRSDAKMIAEELHKFIRNDVRKAVTEMATAETEEYLNAKWKIQCKLPPKTKRFCPLVLK
jgi:hypothetical protein